LLAVAQVLIVSFAPILDGSNRVSSLFGGSPARDLQGSPRSLARLTRIKVSESPAREVFNSTASHRTCTSLSLNSINGFLRYSLLRRLEWPRG
jgi:hypothetical protein